MSNLAVIRAKLAEAERERTTERAAELARGMIRLQQRPVAREGLFGFLGRGDREQDMFFTEEQTKAVYRALAKVRDDCKRRADELEHEVGG